MFNVWLNDGTTEMPDDDVLFIIQKDKIFLKKKVGFIDSIVPVNKISFLQDDIKPSASMDIENIPARVFGQILAFFREVYNNYNRNEANTVIHFNEQKGIFKVQVPLQKTSGGSVEYLNTQIKGFQRIGTIHSHASMSAFHSPTDDKDEVDFDGLHITIGNVDKKYVSISCSIVVNGTRFMCDPMDYIDGLEFIEYEEPGSPYKIWKNINGVFKMVTAYSGKQKITGYKLKEVINENIQFPKNWLKMVDKIKYDEKRKEIGLDDSNHNNVYKYLNQFSNIHSSFPHHDPRISNNTFEDKDDEWNPCEQCPYRDHKTDIMLQEVLDSLDDDELDSFGFEEFDGDNTPEDDGKKP